MGIVAISGKINSGKDTLAAIFQYLTSQAYKEYKDKYSYASFLVDNKSDYKNSNSKWQIKKFADKLKDTVCLLLNCTREQLEDRDFKEKELGEEWWVYKSEAMGKVFHIHPYSRENNINGIYCAPEEYVIDKLTPRKLLQLLGTDCGRDIIHPNIWVNSLMSEYKDISTSNDSSFHEPRMVTRSFFAKYPNWIITDMRFANELNAVKSKGGISVRIERKREVPLEACVLPPNSPLIHLSETALDDAQFDYTIHNDGTIEELIEAVKVIIRKEKII